MKKIKKGESRDRLNFVLHQKVNEEQAKTCCKEIAASLCLRV